MGFSRAEALSRLADESFDVLVVGGGITGAGVALDAASRGLRTALVERRDLASGTSSKSSKLVHGGLRYLQQREYRLVYEALAERQRLRQTAPHLVRLLPFLMPMFGRGGLVHPRLVRGLSSVLWLYDLTGGVRIGRLHDRISVDEVLAHMPTLRRDRVVGGFVYYDARTDDARLTLTVARTASDYGAAVANWCEVEALTKDGDGRVTGARVRPEGEGEIAFDVHASVVVNATGVWSDTLRMMDEGVHPDTLRPAKGIHISVPWAKVRNEIAAVLPVPADKRSVFVVPHGEITYIGTTDTDYDGPLDDPQCTPAEVNYLLAAVNASLTDPLTRDDVVGTWAGLRPLLKSGHRIRTTDLSRRHRITRSRGGVVSVTGGKLTTYRRMASDAVDEVVRAAGRGGHSRTARLRLHGADGFEALVDPDAPARLEVDPDLLAHLAHRHGADARVVVAMIAAEPTLAEPLVPTLPYVRAEALVAVRYELARTLDDVLARRIPARWLARDASAEAAEDVARLVAPDLGWTADDITREVAAYRAAVTDERRAAGFDDAPARAAGALPVAGG